MREERCFGAEMICSVLVIRIIMLPMEAAREIQAKFLAAISPISGNRHIPGGGVSALETIREQRAHKGDELSPYTHLTLPTKRIV
jgi:hypothetical protein